MQHRHLVAPSCRCQAGLDGSKHLTRPLPAPPGRFVTCSPRLKAGASNADMDRSYLLLPLADPSEGSLGRLCGQCPGLMDIPCGVDVTLSVCPHDTHANVAWSGLFSLLIDPHAGR